MANADQNLTVGIVWQDVVTALRPAFWTLFAVAAPFILLVDMVLALYGPPPPQTQADLTPQVVLILIGIPLTIGAIAQLAIARMVVLPAETPRAALATALAMLPAYLGALLLTGLPTGLGLLLLLVPGLYLMARLFLVLPVVAVERLGPVPAIRRSWAMTEPCGWTIVMLLVLGLLFLLGTNLVATGVGAAIASVLAVVKLKSVASFVAALLPALASTAVSIIAAAAAAVIYRRVAA